MLNQQTKTCGSCKKEKPIDDFGLRSNKKWLRSYCRDCEVIKRGEWEKTEEGKRYRAEFERNNRKVRPARYRDYELRRNYGISLQEWQKLFDSQGNKCAICRRSNPSTKKGWHTDHSHTKPKKVRGILCGRCNSILGYAGDSPVILFSALQYLLKNSLGCDTVNEEKTT